MVLENEKNPCFTDPVYVGEEVGSVGESDKNCLARAAAAPWGHFCGGAIAGSWPSETLMWWSSDSTNAVGELENKKYRKCWKKLRCHGHRN
jgi:hypothetical protein